MTESRCVKSDIKVPKLLTFGNYGQPGQPALDAFEEGRNRGAPYPAKVRSTTTQLGWLWDEEINLHVFFPVPGRSSPRFISSGRLHACWTPRPVRQSPQPLGRYIANQPSGSAGSAGLVGSAYMVLRRQASGGGKIERRGLRMVEMRAKRV